MIMHPLRRTLSLLLLLLPPLLASSQGKTVAVGAQGSLFVPLGSLGDRFLSGMGGSVCFRLLGDDLMWGGMIEYLKFDRENTDKLFATRKVTVGTAEQIFTIPLPKLTMSMEAFGAGVVGSYEVWSTSLLSARASAGFGVYRWKASRSSYYDSLIVQTAAGPILADNLKVPALEQQDWSGGFNAGLDLGVRLFDPAWLTIGARYKIIVGELWPSLALDLENVSTFQMLDLRAGLSVDL